MTGTDDSVAEYLAKHPVFAGLEPQHLEQVSRFAQAVQYRAGQRVFERGIEARELFIVRRGQVTIEVAAIGGESLNIQSVGEGSLLGWSWLIPPYRWSFDARAVSESTLIVVDGVRLRGACDADPRLGYPLVKRIAGLMAERLNAARLSAMRHYAGL